MIIITSIFVTSIIFFLFVLVVVWVGSLTANWRDLTRNRRKLHEKVMATMGVPPRPIWNCRCTTIPFMRPALERVKKKKMHRDAKNFMVQAMNGEMKYGKTFYNWQFDPPVLGKEQKMSKKKEGSERLNLKGRFVRTPTQELWDLAKKMLKELGIREPNYNLNWRSDGGSGPLYLCVLRDSDRMLGSSTKGWFEEQASYKEITFDELNELTIDAKKPVHTLMTRDECIERFDPDKGMDGALVLSIDKWERLTEPKNWKELISGNPLGYMGGDTCALCKFSDENCDEEDECEGCPLQLGGGDCNWSDHPWTEAHDAALAKDEAKFRTYGNRLLAIMRNALVELREPKTYKLGQFFQRDDDIMILGRTSTKRVGLILVGSSEDEDLGDVWSTRSANIEVETSRLGFTEEHFAEMAGGEPERFRRVEVEVTVKKGMKR